MSRTFLEPEIASCRLVGAAMFQELAEKHTRKAAKALGKPKHTEHLIPGAKPVSQAEFKVYLFAVLLGTSHEVLLARASLPVALLALSCKS